MKYLIVLLLVLSNGTAISVLAQNYDPRRTISVTGTADIKVKPDQVEISMSVETHDVALTKARSDNDSKVSAVLAMLKDLGVDEKNVQTDYLRVEPRYDSRYNTSGDETSRKFLGYYMTKNITVILKDISKYEKLIANALELGTNYINGATFQRSDTRKYRDQVRLDAIQAAKEKADALAAKLGQKVGKPITITEGSPMQSLYRGYAANSISMAKNSGDDGDASTVSAGELTIEAQVSVTFELE